MDKHHIGLGLLLVMLGGTGFAGSTADRQQRQTQQIHIFPEPFKVKTLGTYRLGQNETIHDIILDLRDGAYTLVYQKQTGTDQREYYVRQGTKTLGPFSKYTRSYSWYTRDYAASGAWYTEKNEPHQYFIGSAKSIYGPIGDPDIFALQYVQFEDKFLSYQADIGLYDKKDTAYLLEDGEWKKLLEQDVSNIHIASGSGKAAYTYRSNGENFIMLDGESQGPFYYVDGIGWSSDGEQYMYAYGDAQASGTWETRFKHILFGEHRFSAETGFQQIGFSPDGTMPMFIDGPRLTIVSAAGTIVKTILSEKGEIHSYKVSKNSELIAYTSVVPEANEQYVVLCYPDNNTIRYGPFINGTVAYDFSPNTKVFYCKGNKAGQTSQVIYLDNKEYAINDDHDRIRPVFTAQENRYAGLQEDKNWSFIADIDMDTYFRGNVLHTEGMSVIVAPDMEQVILPDGTPVYWTQQQDRKYLHLFYDQYGPFDFANDYSDASIIRWLICYRGNIQLITIER
ncbi:MAG: hypothetical protein LBD29_01835 [Treponema sp.]|jgi:hypothetical protein|nr:hypothetical protein [Treponema sp.]